jgi:hypothetical protein
MAGGPPANTRPFEGSTFLGRKTKFAFPSFLTEYAFDVNVGMGAHHAFGIWAQKLF